VAKGDLGRRTCLCTLQHGGDGFGSHDASNHRSAAQRPSGGVVAAGEFCPDAVWRCRPRRPATARPRLVIQTPEEIEGSFPGITASGFDLDAAAETVFGAHPVGVVLVAEAVLVG